MAISIDPNTTVWLCKVPLENDYKNQFKFASLENQIAYFRTTVFTSFSNSTYVRKNGYIDVPFSRDYIRTCNYLYYTNPGGFNSIDGQGESQTVFCFITDIEYLSENSSRVYIETDVYQTWQFRLHYNRCFIEREHVNDDTMGLHTVPENLETGEYVINGVETPVNFGAWGYVLSTMTPLKVWEEGGNIYINADIDSDFHNVRDTGGVYNGIYGASDYYLFTNAALLCQAINILTKAGKLDSIVGVFLVPYVIAVAHAQEMVAGSGVYQIISSQSPYTMAEDVEMNNSLNGYSPKNNKLKCFPYNYLMVANGGGQSSIYRWEECTTKGKFEFIINGVICPGCSIRLNPYNYKGTSYNFSEGMNLSKFPTCSFPADMYTNWLTQNSIDIMGTNITTDDVALVGALTNMGGNMISGGLYEKSGNKIGQTMSEQNLVLGVGQVANSIISMNKHDMTPSQLRGNVNSGDVITSGGDNTFTFYKKSIKAEYARIIDSYFSVYGYKVNRVGTPNITGRRNWNYVKTIGCNFDGDIPNEDLAIIRAMFDRGVTIWHNPQNIYRYDLDNSII